MQEQDPFWEDPNTEVLIGTVHVYLQSLAYLIELEETLRISDFKGNEQGVVPHSCYQILLTSN